MIFFGKIFPFLSSTLELNHEYIILAPKADTALKEFANMVLSNVRELISSISVSQGVRVVQRPRDKGLEGEHKLWTYRDIERNHTGFLREIKDAMSACREVHGLYRLAGIKMRPWGI